MPKRSIPDLQNLRNNTPLVMVTAYDYPSGQQAAAADVDLILVGDSLGNVILGYESTALVTLADMIHHAKATRRGAPDTFMVVDMPFGTYTSGLEAGLKNAVHLMQATTADALKVEGCSLEVLELVQVLTRNGIPVMGHVGLTPQTATSQGGLRVQGRDEDAARHIINGAFQLQQAGAFAVVLEVIPARLAEVVTEKLHIPTIGIGAGVHCSGQVLVYHDLLGVYENDRKKLAKRYAEVGRVAREGLSSYVAEVRQGLFPTKENSFVIKTEVLEKLY